MCHLVAFVGVPDNGSGALKVHRKLYLITFMIKAVSFGLYPLLPIPPYRKWSQLPDFFNDCFLYFRRSRGNWQAPDVETANQKLFLKKKLSVQTYREKSRNSKFGPDFLAIFGQIVFFALSRPRWFGSMEKVSSGNTPGPDHSGNTLRPLWDHSGTTLGPHWDHSETTMGPFWNHSQTTL